MGYKIKTLNYAAKVNIFSIQIKKKQKFVSIADF